MWILVALANRIIRINKMQATITHSFYGLASISGVPFIDKIC